MVSTVCLVLLVHLLLHTFLFCVVLSTYHWFDSMSNMMDLIMHTTQIDKRIARSCTKSYKKITFNFFRFLLIIKSQNLFIQLSFFNHWITKFICAETRLKICILNLNYQIRNFYFQALRHANAFQTASKKSDKKFTYK